MVTIYASARCCHSQESSGDTKNADVILGAVHERDDCMAPDDLKMIDSLLNAPLPSSQVKKLPLNYSLLHRMIITMLTLKLTASFGALDYFFLAPIQASPVAAGTGDSGASLLARAVWTDDWLVSLSDDTRHRLVLARTHLDDESTLGQAFRNDTIMR